MKGMIKNTVILTVITLIAGALLGGVYEITKEPIAKEQERAKQEAYKKVFTSAQSFENYDFDTDIVGSALAENGLGAEDIASVAAAKSESGELLGYVVNSVTHEGYGGDINVSVGISLAGDVLGVEILDISETAGLGMKAKNAEFREQFIASGVKSFKYTKNGKSADNEIDALSGATITSNAMTNAVNAALVCFDVVSDKEVE